MSYITPPTPVTGALITLNNPGAEQNSSPPVAVQIRNASGYVLTVSGAGPQTLLDPFTAATVAISLGENVVIDPSFQAYTNLGSGYLSAEWLLDKEQPTEPDGPLTSAATIATVSGTINTNVLNTVATNIENTIISQLENFELGEIVYAAPGSTTNLNVPANVHSIKIFEVSGNGVLTITGHQSGYIYGQLEISTPGVAIVPFSTPSMDTSLDFQITGATTGGTLWVTGSSDPTDINVALLNGSQAFNRLSTSIITNIYNNAAELVTSVSGNFILGAPAAGQSFILGVISASNGGTASNDFALNVNGQNVYRQTVNPGTPTTSQDLRLAVSHAVEVTLKNSNELFIDLSYIVVNN